MKKYKRGSFTPIRIMTIDGKLRAIRDYEEIRSEREFVKAFTPNKYGEYA